MKNLNLRILTGTLGRRPRLRADRIRRDTLTQLAAALVEDHDSDVINALHDLVDAMKHDAPDVEIDALVQDIEDVADMGRPVVGLSDADVRQLADEAAAAVRPVGTVTAFPQQQNRRAS